MEESATPEIQEANGLILNVKENSESEWAASSPSTENESQSREYDREGIPSIGNRLQDMVLANDLRKMLESSEPPLSRKYCCIYRVPRDLRKLNEEAYTPQFISIGPFHHGNKRLEIMEKLKLTYFNRFVKKAALNLESLVSYIRSEEGNVRRCYSETSELSSDNYVKMILLDASFIIVFFLIRSKPSEWVLNSFYDDFTELTPRLIRDMWLLENQLPFFVIEGLYNFAFASCSNHPSSFTQLAFEFFVDYNAQKMSPNSHLKIKHFLDLLRTFFLPPSKRLPPRNYCDEKDPHLYTVSQLHEAGVKFLVSSDECLFDLEFTKPVLKIPCLTFYDKTESFFRNLIALEQCHYRWNSYVTDYMRILDCLIDTTKDVDLLVQKGILVNHLGESNAVTTLINNLCKQIFVSKTNSYYCDLCKGLYTFYNDPRHRWKATLRRDYFSTPWRIASTIAAIILLVLTFTQTVCSIISLV